MRRCFLIVALLAAGTPAFAADLHVFGKWTDDGNCTAPFVVITAKTYKVSGGPTGSIKSIERNGNDFLVELRDGYRFAMLDVGERTGTWSSPSSGDTFDVTRCK